jgi:iron complex transport system substrate-binding protein
MNDLETISADVVDAALHLHRELGPGLLESVYEMVLAAALARRGYAVLRQQPVDIEFDGIRFPGAFRADLIIEGRLVVEIKSVERLTGAHTKQATSHLFEIDESAHGAADQFWR